MIKGEVIIIMDSNRQYIDHEKFWNGHSCKIMRAGQISDGKKILLNYEFSEAKVIFIHLGTNDIEKIDCIENTTKELINLGILAKRENPKADIILSEIPIRNDYLNERRLEVNNLLKKSIPESLHIIQHQNVTRDMLYDKKHIKENCIQHIVRNMKDKLRELLRINRDDKGNVYYEKESEQKGMTLLSHETVFRKKINSLLQFLTEL